MSPRTVERVDDWETVPFGGGYSGLRDLASQEFSGAVTAGPTRLFMIRGTVVGVLDGSIDDFEEASGAAREAPHPALPLLAVMQERSDEVRAKYYTEDTPIADVDRTLADGSFTGFVELSENVLSGDYYQVYHQGRSMSVAYVGTAERLITDDEAFEQANDEVGIYEVRPVTVDAVDVPEPATDTGSATAAEAGGGDPSAAASTDEDVPDTGSDDAPATGADTVDIPSATAESELDEPAADASEPHDGAGSRPEPPDPAAAESEPADAGAGAAETGTRAADEAGPRDRAGVEPDEAADESDVPSDVSASSSDEPSTASRTTGRDDAASPTDQSGERGTSETAGDAPPGANASSASSTSRRSNGPGESRQTTTDSTSSRSDDADRVQPDQQPSGNGQPSGNHSGGRETRTQPSGSSSGTGAADLELRSIPSLDPARTKAASKATAKRTPGGRADATTQSAQPQDDQRSERGQQRSSEPATQSSPDGSVEETPQSSSPQQSGQSDRSTTERQANETAPEQSAPAAGDEDSELAGELESREQEIDDLRTDLERVEAERDELETKAAELEAERDRLQSELREAQSEIDRLTERVDDFASEGDAAGTQISASEAIDNTNLFVRYRSKGDATLETAHSGNADRSAVEENMRLEYHTQFDAADAAVGNEPFDDFLTGTVQYRFVDWIIGSLLYEVRDTGHADGMADLYNALPEIDRAELNGQVSVNYTEDGEEHRSQERFDVVVRDRMGNPLVVANINNSRDPATDAMMTDLVKRAERVGESSETLAGAFLVTESFFEPEALETAEGATSSGLFSRDKRKSFVNLSRKGGYHLCLVEARNQEFHLAVPEL